MLSLPLCSERNPSIKYLHYCMWYILLPCSFCLYFHCFTKVVQRDSKIHWHVYTISQIQLSAESSSPTSTLKGRFQAACWRALPEDKWDQPLHTLVLNSTHWTWDAFWVPRCRLNWHHCFRNYCCAILWKLVKYCYIRNIAYLTRFWHVVILVCECAHACVCSCVCVCACICVHMCVYVLMVGLFCFFLFVFYFLFVFETESITYTRLSSNLKKFHLFLPPKC